MLGLDKLREIKNINGRSLGCSSVLTLLKCATQGTIIRVNIDGKQKNKK